MKDLDQFLEQHREAFENDLCDLLRIPSVSTDSSYRKDVRRAGDWVAEQFRRLNFKTEVISTDRHPIVYAESAPVPGKPVALVYGHYDVQPPDPLNEWTTPPFEPSIRNGNLYARGATDDKGQMLTHVKAVQAWIETRGELPMQVKFLIEGEEEVGSESLNDWLEDPATLEKLACDIVVISDTSQFAPGQPAITYGLKGIAYFELKLQGPSQDLHSGVFGGAVTNPANTLAKMLAALIDDDRKVQIPGFYDDVIDATASEREQFAKLPFTDEQFQQQLGVTGVSGEAGYTTLERRWVRPTFDINGLSSGYQGEGAKTVLPARASAKFSFRLVPNQCPKKVAAALEPMLQKMCPPGITMELVDMHGAPGIVTPLDSPYMQAAADAIESGFGTRPVFIREGGSIPVVTAFSKKLGVDTLLLGWGLNDDNTHSPNEKFCLADYHRGTKASVYLWDRLSQLPAR
ncbi:dipeptidase [Lignipirellula cremea]|uniref:Succinyl-diaminopimelate desuccinylase n=1 Tax=Lignipirellula cremea TaxID=2528010 RepID=A0A518DYT4_9BACT|nr:dipeptidase [Lignipirellula cremea]QDU96961.1 Succinyl-diaminopimelate desuccinylase [Lignipirellula cremea]